MAEQTCGCQPGDVSTETVAQTVDNQIGNLDPQRAEALTGLQAVRATRAAGYTREQKRLALKYGADSPRVAALADKIQFNDGLRRDLDFEVARAKTDTPTVDKDGYVFHGFVRDVKGQGLPRLTVALYDANGNWIRELGYGCTDERGYFLMRYQRGKTDPAGGTNPTFAAFKASATGGTTTSRTQPAARIYVLDAQQTTLHVEPEPLYPKLGEVDFRIIILGAETAPCTPPPDKPGEPQPPKPTTSTPLEKIRGIGPARARILRAAGIKDIEAFLRTDTAKLVEIAGFDAHAAKREAEKTLKSKKK
jgi:hypothetical protein